MIDLPKTFKLYLKTQGVSPVTIKNYLSDFNHFWGWLIFSLQSGLVPFDRNDSLTIIAYFTSQMVIRYKDFLLANKIPPQTVNRRFSTLRQFGKFCISQGWIAANPAKQITNISYQERLDQKEKILTEFKRDLEKERASPLTVKNYLSDLRHFLGWLEAAT